MARKKKSGLIYLDPQKLEQARLRLGLGKTRIADKSGLARNAVLKAFRGEGVFANTAKLIAAELKFADPNDMLPEPVQANSRETVNAEWEVAEYLGPWLTASNSLQYRLCRMRHRFVPEHFGRGKCYDLLNPSLRESERVRTHLVRHSEVCNRVGVHRQIIDNLAAFPGGEGDLWWVIDRWIDAETLEDRWEANSWKAELAPRLACELAQGLAALHQADVVFRELSPRRILIAADDGRACLTDFELAKLLGPAPTVSADWPDDPYRAPEVESGQATVRSDIYSWAKIVVEAFCGRGHAPQGLRQMAKIDGVPNSVQSLLKKCLAPGPSDRPASIGQVATVLQRTWPKLAKESTT